MKNFNLGLLLLLVGVLVPVKGDDLLQNGNFTDGVSHWYGNAQTVADAASESVTLAAKPKPDSDTGVVVKLRSSDWDKVCQDFKSKPGPLNVTVTYTVSPGLTFSAKPTDYYNIGPAVNFNSWRHIESAPGKWTLMISDSTSWHLAFASFEPDLTATGAQTITARLYDLRSDGPKTLWLIFPPGDGTITLQSVSVEAP